MGEGKGRGSFISVMQSIRVGLFQNGVDLILPECYVL